MVGVGGTNGKINQSQGPDLSIVSGLFHLPLLLPTTLPTPKREFSPDHGSEGVISGSGIGVLLPTPLV